MFPREVRIFPSKMPVCRGLVVDGPQQIEVVIRDQGSGIPPADLERVFMPFYRCEGSRNRDSGGSGLGLSIVRSVVSRHGGSVTLANHPEGGLQVTVRLPHEGGASQ